MLANKIEKILSEASAIRRMFEEGIRLKKKFGEEAICDLTLGNPCLEPPIEVKNALLSLIQSNQKNQHKYMYNAGFIGTRQYIAKKLSKEASLTFNEDNVLLCVGAGGGLNVIFRCLLNSQDHVITPTPYFVEYGFYADNCNATLLPVSTNSDFTLNLDALEQAITEKTKLVLINSPHNPTGVVYSEGELTKLGQLLQKKSAQYNYPITLLSDEPYKEIIYEGQVPCVFSYYENTIAINSYSKSLALPGERIGYIAISPKHILQKQLFNAANICTRILGFVNAPALMQRLLPLVDDIKVDLSLYRENRDILYTGLNKIGYKCNKPQGAFYMFIQIPPKTTEQQFIQIAQEQGLLLVPGKAFGLEGFFRLAYCHPTEVITRSIHMFEKVWQICMT